MSKLGAFSQASYFKDTILDLTNCRDIFFENTGSVDVTVGEYKLLPGKTYSISGNISLNNAILKVKFAGVMAAANSLFVHYIKEKID